MIIGTNQNSDIYIINKLSKNDLDFINSDKYKLLNKMLNELNPGDFLNELYLSLEIYFDNKLKL
jgi:hypothetical protein